MGDRRTRGEYCQEPLALITGAPDFHWQKLTPEHPRYQMFVGPFLLQEEWDWRTHAYFWETHIEEWPRKAHKLSSTGLKARHAALWIRAGYSKVQIEAALGYSRDGAPRSLWDRADDYADWLRRQPMLRPEGHGAVQRLEDAFAAGVDPAAPGAAEQARRYVRRHYRAPRVVSFAEWTTSPFGFPEYISTRALYGEPEAKLIERAETELRATDLHGAF